MSILLNGACDRPLVEDPDNAAFLLLRGIARFLVPAHDEDEAIREFRPSWQIFGEREKRGRAERMNHMSTFCDLTTRSVNRVGKELRTNRHLAVSGLVCGGHRVGIFRSCKVPCFKVPYLVGDGGIECTALARIKDGSALNGESRSRLFRCQENENTSHAPLDADAVAPREGYGDGWEL